MKFNAIYKPACSLASLSTFSYERKPNAPIQGNKAKPSFDNTMISSSTLMNRGPGWSCFSMRSISAWSKTRTKIQLDRRWTREFLSVDKPAHSAASLSTFAHKSKPNELIHFNKMNFFLQYHGFPILFGEHWILVVQFLHAFHLFFD